MAELHHGGRLREAAERYRIPIGDWLDLSTGINPHAWPVPPIAACCWQRLPEEDDGLETAAAQYYGTQQLLPLAGSQAAIQLLPQLRPACRVGMLQPSYAEHAHRWRLAGHEVVAFDTIDALDVLLLVNPNNPDGRRFSRELLLEWKEQLAARGGWLIVDEAFIDATPEHSIIDAAGEPGLVVLRSLGKFFGLAGARVGFCAAWPELLEKMRLMLGPWSLSGPAREVARLALSDREWQLETRERLKGESERLQGLLKPDGGTELFQYLRHPDAKLIAERLARRGILVRLFEEPAALRFGLPGGEWQRLEEAMRHVLATTPPTPRQAAAD